MEIKTDALVLRTVDYGENDKMLTLLTAERGKLGVAIKGVKKAGAKLKFAGQPFCFAEYVLAERAGRFTVTSASLHDGFYSLREDIGAYYAGVAVCEACDSLLYEGMGGACLLVSAVHAFERMVTGDVASALVAFLLEALALAGYPVHAETCPACGGDMGEGLFFDLSSGSFFCKECAVGTPASLGTYHLIRRELGLDYDKGRLSADSEKRAIRLLKAYYNAQTDGELGTLGEYLRLL